MLTMMGCPISRYMTPCPCTIGLEQTLEHAHDLMRNHHIRHLPVLEGGRLVGIVSDRDLHIVEDLADIDPKVVKVEEAMTMDVYTAQPNTPLLEVATAMAEHKYGSAIIVEGQHVVGVFTTTDALRALADALSPERLKQALQGVAV